MSTFFGLVLGLSIFGTVMSAWVTHIFYCFGHAAWGFLVAGAIMFPIGILHGFWLWFS